MWLRYSTQFWASPFSAVKWDDLNQWKVDIDQELIELVRCGCKPTNVPLG